MKKKRLKIIGKLSCILLLTSVLVSALVVPSFAWQNTNHELADQWYRGRNSYSLAPINAMYYQYYTENDNSTVNYSVNVPNIITSEGKANWGGSGYPLTARYSERFGNNSRGAMYTYPWDTFAQNSDFVSLVDLPYHNTISVENNPNVSIYPAFTTDEVWTDFSKPATNLDVVSYVVTRQPDTTDIISLECYFDSFITTQSFSKYLITYQWASTDVETAHLTIKYAFSYADYDGVLHNVDGSMLYTGSQTGTLTQSGITYEVDSVSILDAILVHEEEVNNREGLDRESQRLIEWNSVYVSPQTFTQNTIVQCGVSVPYIRPYSQTLIDYANSGNERYISGWYSTIKPYQNTIWYALFEHIGPDKAPELELGTLGDSIGSAVTGVFNAEIFPEISLWTLLLIPFSLGLVFTFIKFFAGG